MITLTVQRKMVQDKESIIYQISDTGIGLEQKQLEKIFKAFQQADNTTTRKYGGTGLGLSITKKFCELMEGSVTVESLIQKTLSPYDIIVKEVKKVTSQYTYENTDGDIVAHTKKT